MRKIIAFVLLIGVTHLVCLEHRSLLIKNESHLIVIAKYQQMKSGFRGFPQIVDCQDKINPHEQFVITVLGNKEGEAKIYLRYFAENQKCKQEELSVKKNAYVHIANKKSKQ
jgi:hypothetical protein